MEGRVRGLRPHGLHPSCDDSCHPDQPRRPSNPCRAWHTRWPRGTWDPHRPRWPCNPCWPRRPSSPYGLRRPRRVCLGMRAFRVRVRTSGRRLPSVGVGVGAFGTLVYAPPTPPAARKSFPAPRGYMCCATVTPGRRHGMLRAGRGAHRRGRGGSVLRVREGGGGGGRGCRSGFIEGRRRVGRVALFPGEDAIPIGSKRLAYRTLE